MKSAGKIGTGAAAVLCTVLVAASLSPTAGAAVTVTKIGGFKYVTKSFELEPGGAKTLKARCPDRHHVLGGGHYNNGLYADVIGAHSYPYDSSDPGRKTDDGWAAQLRGFTESYNAYVYATCAKILPEYPHFLDSVAPSGLIESHGAGCAPLETLSGGSTGPPSVREVMSFPLASQWLVGHMNHSQSAHDVTLYAVCAGLDVVATQSAGDTVAAGEQDYQTATCPKAAPNIVGGGVENESGDFRPTAIAASSPVGFGSFGSWRAYLDNYGSSPIGFSVWAICSPALS